MRMRANDPSDHQRGRDETENTDERAHDIQNMTEVIICVKAENICFESLFAKRDDHVQNAEQQVCDTDSEP